MICHLGVQVIADLIDYGIGGLVYIVVEMRYLSVGCL